MKLCVECKYYENRSNNPIPNFLVLNCKKPTTLSLVDGRQMYNYKSASSERYSNNFWAFVFNECGSEGRFWEAK